MGREGREIVARFEPSGWRESDVWIGALRRLLPAAAFESPRRGELAWSERLVVVVVVFGAMSMAGCATGCSDCRVGGL